MTSKTHNEYEDPQVNLAHLRHEEHPGCFLWNPNGGLGTGLDFKVNSNGEVSGRFDCSEIFQSYSGLIHGGVVSLLLDGAMTNCMFARKKKVVTGMLSVRYLHPVSVNHMADISARLVKSSPPLYCLEAEISQDGKVLATATGKFMERPGTNK